MNVKQIMNQNIVTVHMDDTLYTVKEIFENARFHHLLVVDSDKLYGIISDRDLFKAISPNLGTASETPKDTATLNKRAHQIMSRKPVALKQSADINDVIHVFNSHTISCIPIIDDENRPIGVITWRDIFHLLVQKNKISV